MIYMNSFFLSSSLVFFCCFRRCFYLFLMFFFLPTFPAKEIYTSFKGAFIYLDAWKDTHTLLRLANTYECPLRKCARPKIQAQITISSIEVSSFCFVFASTSSLRNSKWQSFPVIFLQFFSCFLLILILRFLVFALGG